jgi:hypothetical protein
MKKTICEIILFVGALLMLGIMGGIECGEPIRNALWCIPIATVMVCSGFVGEIF